MKSYDHRKIEKKWQLKWKKENLYKTPESLKNKKNFYTLVEFPYPSGNLHIGHWYAFSVPDIYTRFKRMNGFNTLYPIGFDSFGLPAENAAIKRNLDPKKWTYGNIEHMKRQLESMGASFDWSREIITSDPEYYRWTQWIFTKMFEKGLAYKAEGNVNWCPSCMTVLANEQVVNGLCERCESVVEIKRQKQWMLKITEYAERLLKDLEPPAGGLEWPPEIKEQQKNWIGKSEGAEIGFRVQGVGFREEIKVFTTRPDTIFGATYLVLSPEHKVISNFQSLISNWQEVKKYIEETKKKTEIERTSEGKIKTGVELKGIKAVNPANGEEIPIWTADYVLPQYGTGAIMAVPAHDERDFQFAKKYNLPIKQVIEPSVVQAAGSSTFKPGEPYEEHESIIAIVKHWSEEKYLGLRWKEAPDWGTLLTGGVEKGMTAEETIKKEILEETGYKNFKKILDLGKIHSKFYHVPKKTNKFVHADIFYVELQNDTREEINESEKNKHELVWMPLEDLENFLTAVSHKQAIKNLKGIPYTDTGFLTNSEKFNGLDSEEVKEKIIKFVGGNKKTTYKLRDWSVGRQRYWGTPIPIVFDPEGNPHSVPEKHLPWTLPQDVDFKPTGEAPLAKSKDLLKRTEKIFGKGWKPEVETMDTFIDSAWYFLRYLDPKNKKEVSSKEKQKNWMPVDLYFGGSEHTTLHLLYSRFFQKVLFDMKIATENEPYKKRINRGLIMGPDGQKMSKSRGNVVDPDEMVEKVGSDVVKMYLAFIGPYSEVGSYPWDMGGIAGIRRFLERVYSLRSEVKEGEDSDEANEEVEKSLHQTIKKCTEDIENLKFNTAISSLMIFLNSIRDKKITKKQYEIFILTLAPFAPFLIEEIWESLGHKKSIYLESWPAFDPEKILETTVNIAIQINGKVRDILKTQKGESEKIITKKVLDKKIIKDKIEGKKIKKIIYVKDRIINFVIE